MTRRIFTSKFKTKVVLEALSERMKTSELAQKHNLTPQQISTWKTALRNQKGVYLITDKSNGKMYVGSAYGDDMILNRWKSYVNNGNGGNKE